MPVSNKRTRRTGEGEKEKKKEQQKGDCKIVCVQGLAGYADFLSEYGVHRVN